MSRRWWCVVLVELDELYTGLDCVLLSFDHFSCNVVCLDTIVNSESTACDCAVSVPEGSHPQCHCGQAEISTPNATVTNYTALFCHKCLCSQSESSFGTSASNWRAVPPPQMPLQTIRKQFHSSMLLWPIREQYPLPMLMWPIGKQSLLESNSPPTTSMPLCPTRKQLPSIALMS